MVPRFTCLAVLAGHLLLAAAPLLLPAAADEDGAIPEIDRLNEKGISKLHSAAIAGNLEEARRLLEQAIPFSYEE